MIGPKSTLELSLKFTRKKVNMIITCAVDCPYQPIQAKNMLRLGRDICQKNMPHKARCWKIQNKHKQSILLLKDVKWWRGGGRLMMMRTVVYPQILKRPAPLIESWQTSDIMNKTSPCCGTERHRLQNYGSDLYGIIMKNIQLLSNTTKSLSLNKEWSMIGLSRIKISIFWIVVIELSIKHAFTIL